MMTKAEWKIAWRMIRNMRKAVAEAATDMMIYGSGFVRISSTGIEHVPFKIVMEQKIMPPESENSPVSVTADETKDE
jgi:hypothetical protein